MHHSLAQIGNKLPSKPCISLWTHLHESLLYVPIWKKRASHPWTSTWDPKLLVTRWVSNGSAVRYNKLKTSLTHTKRRKSKNKNGGDIVGLWFGLIWTPWNQKRYWRDPKQCTLITSPWREKQQYWISSTWIYLTNLHHCIFFSIFRIYLINILLIFGCREKLRKRKNR